MMNPTRGFVLAAMLGLMVGLTGANAGEIGVTTTGGDVFQNGDWVLGYSFTVNTPISVNALGVYQSETAGLVSSHEVGLWDSSGNLLASTTVPSGTAGFFDSGYRFESISSVALAAGSTYYVGATKLTGDGDGWLQDPTVVAAPEITYDSRRYEFYTGTLVFPDLAGSGTTGYFGANFEFGASAVPEPSTLTLGLIGTSCAILMGWRKSRRRGALVLGR